MQFGSLAHTWLEQQTNNPLAPVSTPGGYQKTRRTDLSGLAFLHAVLGCLHVAKRSKFPHLLFDRCCRGHVVLVVG